MEQRSEGWHDQRLGMITASQFEKLMGKRGLGKTGETYIKDCIVEAITGVHEEIYSHHMAWGVEHEAEAFEVVKNKSDIDWQECIFQPYKGEIKELVGYVGGTPDGVYKNMVLELKCPSNSRYHFERLLDPNQLVEQYKWQVLGEMLVTGANKALVASYDPRFPNESKLVMKLVELENYQDDMNLLIERLKEGIKIYKEIIKKFKS